MHCNTPLRHTTAHNAPQTSCYTRDPQLWGEKGTKDSHIRAAAQREASVIESGWKDKARGHATRECQKPSTRPPICSCVRVRERERDNDRLHGSSPGRTVNITLFKDWRRYMCIANMIVPHTFVFSRVRQQHVHTVQQTPNLCFIRSAV